MAKQIFIILSLFLFVSCTDVMTPEERGIVINRDIYKVYNQDKAMFTAQYMVEDRYEEDFGDLFNKRTKVYWADTNCPYNDNYAVIYRNKCNFGRMWSCDEMYVAISRSGTTHDTALLHEFGHCMKMEMSSLSDGDADHSDGEFWEIIDQAQLVSKQRGW